MKKWKPEIGGRYYASNIFNPDNPFHAAWYDTYIDNQAYENNLVFKTGEEAIACAKKILAGFKGEKNKLKTTIWIRYYAANIKAIARAREILAGLREEEK